MAVSHDALEWTLRGRVVAWLAALATGAAWLGGDDNARIAAAMLCAPLVVDFIAKQRRLHRTEIRTAPRRTVAGATYQETLTIVHRGRGRLRECLLGEARTMRSEPFVLLPDLPAGQPVRIEVRQRSLQRSHALERVFVLASTWPLGLLRARAIVSITADLITEPARVPLQAELVRAVVETTAAPLDRSLQAGPEFHSLREHQPDEDARAVHALRSASLGTLVRVVAHGRMPSRVGLVLDLRRPPGRLLTQGMRRFEWSLGAFASLLGLLRRLGAEAQVLVLAEEPADVVVRGPAQEHELLTLLAEASPCPHRALPHELFAGLQRLQHCFWIPAGAYFAAPEFAAMPGTVTLVGGEIE